VSARAECPTAGDARLARVALGSSILLGGEEYEPWVEGCRLATLGRLLPSVVHQLSTPLASISLRAESLERSARDADGGSLEKTRRYLQALVTEAGKCQDLLALVRIFARPVTADAEAVNVNALCHEASRLVLHEAMRRQVDVHLGLDEALPSAWGSAGRLRQAVLALVLNAVDATPPAGRAVVSTWAEAAGVAVAAADAEGWAAGAGCSCYRCYFADSAE